MMNPERAQPVSEPSAAERAEARKKQIIKLVEKLEEKIRPLYLEIEERSKLNIAIWKMVLDPAYTETLLSEIVFFSKERAGEWPLDEEGEDTDIHVVGEQGDPLERIQKMKVGVLMKALRKAVELQDERSDEQPVTPRMRGRSTIQLQKTG